MKQYKATLLFGAVVAVTVGLLGVNGLFALPSGSATDAMSDGMSISGHATLTLYDENGNIKAYRQADNLIVNVGENCIAEDIFEVDEAASFSCGTTGAGNDVSAAGFQWVGIGTSTLNAANTDQNLIVLVEQRWQDSAVQFTASTGTGSSSAIVIVDAAVPISGTRTIAEAGLFDATGTSGGNMFSRQTFTGINVVNGDSLTVKWTITIGG